MEPLRLLLAFADPPWPNGAAPARSNSALLQGLVARGHHVTSWVAYDTEEDMRACMALFPPTQYEIRFFRRDRSSGLRSKVRIITDPHGFSYSPEFRADLKEAMREPFDAFYAAYNWGGWLGARHREKTLITIHHLYASDVPSVKAVGLRERLLHANRLRAERRLLRAFPNFIALTDRLARDIRRAAPKAHTDVVPLCLDFGRYRFEPPYTAGPPTVGLIGSFHWGPTFSAGERLVTRLWPAIQRRAPDARLLLVGRNAKRTLGPLVTSSSVEIHENVPDTEPYFRRMNVMLYATDSGSGMKVKVMEAVAFGTPVVTNADGIEGLPMEDGVHMGIGEDDATLVEKTLLLLKDHDRARRQSENARRLLERCCDPRIVLDAHERLFRGLARGRR